MRLIGNNNNNNNKKKVIGVYLFVFRKRSILSVTIRSWWDTSHVENRFEIYIVTRGNHILHGARAMRVCSAVRLSRRVHTTSVEPYLGKGGEWSYGTFNLKRTRRGWERRVVQKLKKSTRSREDVAKKQRPGRGLGPRSRHRVRRQSNAKTVSRRARTAVKKTFWTLQTLQREKLDRRLLYCASRCLQSNIVVDHATNERNNIIILLLLYYCYHVTWRVTRVQVLRTAKWRGRGAGGQKACDENNTVIGFTRFSNSQRCTRRPAFEIEWVSDETRTTCASSISNIIHIRVFYCCSVVV